MEILKNFEKQLDYKPIIKNSKNFKKSKDVFVVGMGGSHLAADLIKENFPEINLRIHSNYGLPYGINKKSLLIISSFSGNTEETLDSLSCAFKKNIPVIILSAGGKLIEIAKKKNLSYIQFPDNTLPPRMAIGFSLKAILRIVNKKIDVEVNNKETEILAKKISKKIKGTIPLIYSSEKNKGISYFWKSNFNENSKNPSFNNYFPELNHNEIASLNKKDFSFFLIEDNLDHPRVKLRMNIFKKNYKTINIKGNMIYLILLSLWTSYYLALENNVDPMKVKAIEDLKKQLS